MLGGIGGAKLGCGGGGPTPKPTWLGGTGGGAYEGTAGAPVIGGGKAWKSGGGAKAA